MRCFEAEAFSPAVVQTMLSEFDVAQRDGFEGHFLWEELADGAIHVFVGTVLRLLALYQCKRPANPPSIVTSGHAN